MPFWMVVIDMKMLPQEVNKMDLDDIHTLGTLFSMKSDYTSAFSGYLQYKTKQEAQE